MSKRATLDDLCLHLKAKLASQSSPLPSASAQAAEALARTPFEGFIGLLQLEEPHLIGTPSELLKRQADCFMRAMEKGGWSRKGLATKSKVSRRLVTRLFTSPRLGTRMKTLAALAVTLEAPLFEEDMSATASRSTRQSDERPETVIEEDSVRSEPSEFAASSGGAVDEPERVENDEHREEELANEFENVGGVEFGDEEVGEGEGEDEGEYVESVEPSAYETARDDDRQYSATNHDEAERDDDDVERDDPFAESDDHDTDGDDVRHGAASDDNESWYGESSANSRVEAEVDDDPGDDGRERDATGFTRETDEVIEPEIVNPPPTNSIRRPPQRRVDTFKMMRENSALRAANAKLESTLERRDQQLTKVTSNRRGVEIGAVAGAVGGTGLGVLTLELGDYEPSAIVCNALAGSALVIGGKLLEESDPVVASAARSAGASTIATTIVVMVGRTLRDVWRRRAAPRTQSDVATETPASEPSETMTRQSSSPSVGSARDEPIPPVDAAPKLESHVAMEPPKIAPRPTLQQHRVENSQAQAPNRVYKDPLRRLLGMPTLAEQAARERSADQRIRRMVYGVGCPPQERGDPQNIARATVRSGAVGPEEIRAPLWKLLSLPEPRSGQAATVPENTTSTSLDELLSFSPNEPSRSAPLEKEAARVIQLDVQPIEAPAEDWLSKLLSGS